MSDDWIPFHAAWDALDSLTGTYLGLELLEEALAKGEVQARAGFYVRTTNGRRKAIKTNRPLSAKFWRDVQIVPDPKGGVVRRYFTKQNNDAGDKLQVAIQAHDVRLAREDLLRRWPQLLFSNTDQVAPPSAEPTMRPARGGGRGGRPTKHQWSRAAAYAATYIVENDPKDAADVRKALQDWFAVTFPTSPDDRDVARFISDIFDEIEKLKTTGK